MEEESKENLAEKLNLILEVVKKIESLRLKEEDLVLESLELLRKKTWHKYLEL